jgi:chromosome segregation ATPase
METMNTDTPETDGEWNRLACQDHPEFERNLADFARKLERERDEVLEQVQQLNHQLDRSQAAGTIWYRRCFSEDAEWNLGELTKLTEERDELRDMLQEEQRLHIQTLNERDEAREETIRTREFMGRGFAKAKEELATMETRHAATMMHTQSVVEDAKQLREQRDAVTLRLGNTQERMIDAERQRDRLAEALNKIQLVMVDGFDKLKRIDEIATEALQSLTPKEL